MENNYHHGKLRKDFLITLNKKLQEEKYNKPIPINEGLNRRLIDEVPINKSFRFFKYFYIPFKNVYTPTKIPK